MELLISFYDDFLIYYPNIFFIFSFLICILFIILAFKITRYILKKDIRSFGKMQLQSIKIINFPIVPLLRFFEKINKILEYLKIKVEIILKRIGREILIDE